MKNSIKIDQRSGRADIDVRSDANPFQQSITVNGPVTGLKIFNSRLAPCWDLNRLIEFLAPRDLPARERALRIWYFSCMHLGTAFYPYELGRPVSEDFELMKQLNVYATGDCVFQNRILTALFQAAGIPARVLGVPGHTICEAYYDGSWHLMDAIRHETFAFLTDKDDGKSLEENLDLTYALSDENDFGVRKHSYSHDYAGRRKTQIYLRMEYPQVKDLSLTLSKYETVEMFGYPKGHYITHDLPEHEEKNFIPYEPLNYGNIRFTFKAGSLGKPFQKETSAFGLYNADGITVKDGRTPVVAIFNVGLPYVFTDGHVKLDVEGKFRLKFTTDKGTRRGTTWRTLKPSSMVDLTRRIRERYYFQLWVEIPPGSCLKGIAITAWAQCVPSSLPLLLSGRNRISYEMACSAGGKIEYAWKTENQKPDWKRSSVEVSPFGAAGGFIRVKLALRDSRGKPLRQHPFILKSSCISDIPLCLYSLGSPHGIAEKSPGRMNAHTTDLEGVANWVVITRAGGLRTLTLFDGAGQKRWKSKPVNVFKRRVRALVVVSARDAIMLSWQPVPGAKSYKLRWQKDFSDRRGEMLVPGHSPRIDLNAEHGFSKGDGYSFQVSVPADPDCAPSRIVTGSFGNLAFGKKTFASCHYGQLRVPHITAGNRHESDPHPCALGYFSERNEVTIDLGKPRTVSRIIYDNINAADLQTKIFQPAFRFEGSKNGRRFKRLVEKKGLRKAQLFILDFKPVELRYIRLRVLDSFVAKGGLGIFRRASSGFIEVYYRS